MGAEAKSEAASKGGQSCRAVGTNHAHSLILFLPLLMAREGRPQGKRPQNTWRFRCLGRASIARKGRSKTNPLGPVAAPLDNTTPTLAAVSELGTSTAGMQHRWRRAWPLVFREGVGSLCRTIQWHTSNRWGFPHCSNRVDRLERKLRPVDSTSGLRSSENLRHLDSP